MKRVLSDFVVKYVGELQTRVYGFRAVTVPTLTTKRLTLRVPVVEDGGFVRALVTDKEVRRFLGGVIDVTSMSNQDLVSHYVNAQDDCWVVTDTHTGACLGLVSLGPHKDGVDFEISYQFAPTAWGQGYAHEALTRLLGYAFDVRQLNRVIAETQKANARSVQLLRRLNMTKVNELMRFGETQLIFASVRPHSSNAKRPAISGRA